MDSDSGEVHLHCSHWICRSSGHHQVHCSLLWPHGLQVGVRFSGFVLMRISQLPRHLVGAALDHLHHVLDRVPQGDPGPRGGGGGGSEGRGAQTTLSVSDTGNQYPFQRLRQENYMVSTRGEKLNSPLKLSGLETF